jgi:hypothetical protein
MAKQKKPPKPPQRSKKPTSTTARSRPLLWKKRAATTAPSKKQFNSNVAQKEGEHWNPIPSREKTPPPSPSPIALLPLEITYMIADLLPDFDLSSLSRTSSYFRHLLSGHLYKRLLTASICPKFPPGYTETPSWYIPEMHAITALQWAVDAGNARLLERLMVDKKITLADHAGKSGYTLLARAARSGDGDTLLLVLRSANELEVPDSVLFGNDWQRVNEVIFGCKGDKCLRIVLEEVNRRWRKSRKGRIGGGMGL